MSNFQKSFFLLLTMILSLGIAVSQLLSPQIKAQTEIPDLFRVGERLTYNISFGRFENVAFAETHVVSRGRVAGKDAIEIQARMKTLNFVVMEFLLLDILRTTLASPVDGTTIFIKDVDSTNGAAVETITSFAAKGGGLYDLSTIVYRLRSSSGNGAFDIFENDKRYSVSFSTVGAENVSTASGDFSTNIIDVQSSFLTEKGISSLKINLTADEDRVPVLYRAKTVKGEFKATIASIQTAQEATPTPTPVAVPTQITKPTPKPTATPYIENEPLIGMPFQLGEVLDYRVSTGGRSIGVVSLSAKDRKLINGNDSLVLRANVTQAATNEIFRVGNGLSSFVDTSTLAPFEVDVRFDGPLAVFTQNTKFDWVSGKASVSNGSTVDIPVGTHSVLSLIYAMRQFNLHQSRDPNSPVNDTRVAVLWQGKVSIFVLKPTQVQTISVGEQKLSAQKVLVSTGLPQLDALNIAVWLGEDPARTPLRLSIGAFQFDLIVTDNL